MLIRIQWFSASLCVALAMGGCAPAEGLEGGLHEPPVSESLSVLTSTQHLLTGDWYRSGTYLPAVYDSANGAWYTAQENSPFTKWQTVTLAAHASPFAGDFWGEKRQRKGWRVGNTFYLEGPAEPYPPLACGSGCPTGYSCAADGYCSPALVSFTFGDGTGIPIAGDWNADGKDTVGTFKDGAWCLRNTNSSGACDLQVSFGQAGDQPLRGDWNNNGAETLGVFRAPNTFLLRDWWSSTAYTSANAADYSITFGTTGDLGLAGDWNGDGRTTVGVFRPSNNTYYYANSNVASPTIEHSFVWSPPAAAAARTTTLEVATVGDLKKVIRFDPAVTDWNSASAVKWTWVPADSGLGVEYGGLTDVKLRYFGKLMVTSSNYGSNPGNGVAVIRVSDKARIWSKLIPFNSSGASPNVHSIEYLPDGNVAVAGVDWVRVYPTNGSTAAPAEVYLGAGHGVYWDDERQVLWALGTTLRALRYTGTRSNPSLQILDTLTLPDDDGNSTTHVWGHDLNIKPGTSRLYVTSNHQVNEFDMRTRTWTSYAPSAPGGSFVKSINKHPYNGQLMETRASSSDYSVDTVSFYKDGGSTSGDTVRTKTGGNFYKARYWVPPPGEVW